MVSVRKKLARVCASALAISLFCSQVALAETNIGNTQVVVNDVKGAMGTQTPVVLHAGIDVFENEVIRTGPKSASRVVFQDHTNLDVGASSQVTLDRFVFDPDPAKSAVALSIAKGVARFTTGNLPKSSYKVTTPTATIGVRGTVLTITVAEDGTTTVSVEEGIAVITAGGVAVEVGPGMSTTVVAGKAPTTPQPTPTEPPVTEMDYLLADNTALPPGPSGGNTPPPEGFTLGSLPVGVTLIAVAGVIVVIAISESANSTVSTGGLTQ